MPMHVSEVKLARRKRQDRCPRDPPRRDEKLQNSKTPKLQIAVTKAQKLKHLTPFDLVAGLGIEPSHSVHRGMIFIQGGS